MTTKLRIAMVLGDPAGIGPEIVAKLLADDTVRQQAKVLLIGDRGEAEQGMRYAGVAVSVRRDFIARSFHRVRR